MREKLYSHKYIIAFNCVGSIMTNDGESLIWDEGREIPARTARSLLC